MHDQVGFIANVDDRFAGLNRKGRMNNRIYRALPAPLQKQGGRRGGASGGRLASGVRSVAMTPSEGYRLLDRHVSPMLSAPVRDLVAEDASEWLSRRLRTFFERARRGAGAAAVPAQVHRLAAGRAAACGVPGGAVRARRPRRPRGGLLARPAALVGRVQRPRWLELRPAVRLRRRALAGVGPVVHGAGRPRVEAADAGVRRGAGADAGGELAGAALRGRRRASPRAGAAAARPPRPGVDGAASSGRLPPSSSLPTGPAPTGTSSPPRDVEMLDRALAPALRDHGYSAGE